MQSRLLILIWLASTCGACWHPAPPIPPVQVVQQCLRQPPPVLPPEIGAGLVDSACPASDVCFSGVAAIALGRWIADARGWMAEAWAAGGPISPTKLDEKAGTPTTQAVAR